jgi:hypothetical protein
MLWCSRWKRGLIHSRSPMRAEAQAQVGVLQALAELREGDEGDELPRRHADQLRHDHDERVAHMSSSRWLRLSLHIVIWRCEWCSECRLHHQLNWCWPRWIQ